jgi:hypothetical protein
MTNRERWIVYPLLFLTLGLGMRDKVAPPSPRFMRPGLNALNVRCAHLDCQDLTITGPSGEKRVRMGVTPNQAGQMEIYGANHSMVLVAGADNTGLSGRVETLAADAIPQVSLHSTDRGGQVATFDRDDKSRVVLGYDALGPGTFLIEPQEKGVNRYTFRWLPVRVGTVKGPSGGAESHDSAPAKQ